MGHGRAWHGLGETVGVFYAFGGIKYLDDVPEATVQDVNELYANGRWSFLPNPRIEFGR
jgi:hypothetical protein